MDLYELRPKYDGRKSFYGKAQVAIDKNGEKQLFSYGTKVAKIKNGKAKINGTYSATTLRHIKEFLKQNNFNANRKKDIEKKYFDKWGK